MTKIEPIPVSRSSIATCLWGEQLVDELTQFEHEARAPSDEADGRNRGTCVKRRGECLRNALRRHHDGHFASRDGFPAHHCRPG